MAKKTTAAPTPQDPASPMTPEQFRKIAEPSVRHQGQGYWQRGSGRETKGDLSTRQTAGRPRSEALDVRRKSNAKYAKALGYSNGRLSMIRKFAD